MRWIDAYLLAFGGGVALGFGAGGLGLGLPEALAEADAEALAAASGGGGGSALVAAGGGGGASAGVQISPPCGCTAVGVAGDFASEPPQATRMPTTVKESTWTLRRVDTCGMAGIISAPRAYDKGFHSTSCSRPRTRVFAKPARAAILQPT